MKRALLITLFVILFGSLAAQAQGSGTWSGVSQCWNGTQWVTVQGNCPSTSSSSGGGSSAGYGLPGVVFDLSFRFTQWLFGGSSDPQGDALRQQQQQQMMEELARREAEARRRHQEEEARRLAAIYNRLQSTLKLSGLPHLELKTSGSTIGGLHLKTGDDATSTNVAGNQHVRGFNEGGVPGIQNIYNGGPSPFWPSDKTTTTQPPTTSSGLQLKMGDVGPAPPAPVAVAPQPATADFNKMTPQQLADAADTFSKLPPEEQQRLIAAAQAAPPAPQQAPPQPVTSLQQQANASQVAASAPSLEAASAQARAGFDTPLGPGAVSVFQPAAPRVPAQSGPAATPVQSHVPASARVNPPLPSGPAMAATVAPGSPVEPPAARTPVPAPAPAPVASRISQLTEQQLQKETCHAHAMLFTMKGDFEADSRHLQDWYEESDKAQREALETSYKCLNDMIKEELGGWLIKRLAKTDLQRWGTEATLAVDQFNQDIEEADKEYNKSAHTREDSMKYTQAVLQAFYSLSANKATGFNLSEYGADLTSFMQCSSDYATAAMEWNLAKDEINQTNDNLNGKLRAQQVLSKFYRELVDESLRRGLDPASCH